MADATELREGMVERQIFRRGIEAPSVLTAFRSVPREAFVPEAMREFAYEDGPLPIGEGQTISQPYIVALMIDAAEIPPGGRVLEVGAGSGYAAAVMSRIAGEVFAIERHEPLAQAAAERIDALGYDNVAIIRGDGSLGLPDEAPFDAILVSAGGDHVPEPLKRQLTTGGRLIVPVGGEEMQSLLCVTRTGEHTWEEHDLGGVRFVPLIGRHGRYEDGSRAATNHQPAHAKTLPEPVAEAAEPLPERLIGAIYHPETERRSHYSQVILPGQFDTYV
jgi:protein-L-isoaspartate(D-aspartate) O-methyltransferase